MNDGEVLISGISDPGAALSVDGKAVGRNKDGSFEFIIPLSPGKNTFEFIPRGKNVRIHIVQKLNYHIFRGTIFSVARL